MSDKKPKDAVAEGDFAAAMMAEGEDKKERLEKAAGQLQAEMEAAGEQIRALVLAQPPTEFLGYLWSQFVMGVLQDYKKGGPNTGRNSDLIGQFQFVLEYVHAVWSSNKGEFAKGKLDEKKAKELLAICDKLRTTAMFYAMASSQTGDLTDFGSVTPDVEFKAKSSWILIRGHRYQVLEREFFEFALAPHEGALKSAYGIGAKEIADGMQSIADRIRAGYGDAVTILFQSFEECQAVMAKKGLAMGDAVKAISGGKSRAEIGEAIRDIFYGGICNVSKHTKLPAELLQDMGYTPGSEESFYADGPLKGTPFRTLPARVRPLVKLADGFYATDGQFVRDSAYRAIQRGLIARKPDYREGWNKNQKVMTETAFLTILEKQLKGAQLYEEVYFKDPKTGSWVETDLVGILDDILFIVEAKAGVMAMQSPATNFQSHIRTIRELVLKAYHQCARFADYLGSETNAPIYRLKDGKYEEVARIDLKKFRHIFSLGLTVESFTPFSSMCKEIPEVTPILGKYPFVSMSVDDLFVLNRFLPSGGEFFHYLEVRQSIAGIPQAMIFDEMDHLGAYIARNRFDLDIKKQLEKADIVTWDAFSEVVDKHFEQDGWANEPVPCQAYPAKLNELLDLLDRERPSGWLRADAEIRNFDGNTREKIGSVIDELVGNLKNAPVRRLTLGNENPFQIWFTTQVGQPAQAEMQRQGELACLAAEKPQIKILRIQCDSKGSFLRASSFEVAAPSMLRNDYSALKSEAERQLTKNKAFGNRRK